MRYDGLYEFMIYLQKYQRVLIDFFKEFIYHQFTFIVILRIIFDIYLFS